MNTLFKLKPAKYFICLVIVFLLFELLFNCFSNIFSNTTDRIRLKSAMFDFRDKTEVLFLGSSRFKDGISPKLFSKHLDSIKGIKLRAFNGAITGANIERLEFFFNKATNKKGTEHIFIEISRPQLQRKEEDIKANEIEEKDIDYQMASFFEEKSKLIQWRKSLRFDNLKNIPAILFANHMEGSELYKKGALRDLTKSVKSTLNTNTKQEWNYSVITPSSTKNIAVSDQVIYNTFKRIAKTAKETGIKITFIIPPLANISRVNETTTEMYARFQNLASVTGLKIYDFSSANINESYFRDKDSHLNKEGCYIFSQLLAELLANTTNSANKL